MTITIDHINPTTWNAGFRYDQAQLRPTPTQVLTLAGQGAIHADGSPDTGDMSAQLALSMDNVEELLAAGGMNLGDVTSMTVYATDVDQLLASYQVITDRLDVVGATPPATVVGVTRLAIASMLVEITVTAAR